MTVKRGSAVFDSLRMMPICCILLQMLMSANRITEAVSTFVRTLMVAIYASAGLATNWTVKGNHAYVSCIICNGQHILNDKKYVMIIIVIVY